MPKLTEQQVLKRDAKRDLNAELLESVKDLKAGRVGRVWVRSKDGAFQESPVTQARACSQLTQAEFAGLLGVSVRTLQQWEQGRREPSGAAKTLIKVATEFPKVLKKVA
jgi:putative transcriptional regulator